MNKITHLIPATEFIGRYDIPGTETPEDLKVFANEIYNYAQFLKQPLQEWMFDGENALFDYPRRDREWIAAMISDGEKVELLTNFTDIVYLTPKALEQIYGSI